MKIHENSLIAHAIKSAILEIFDANIPLEDPDETFDEVMKHINGKLNK